MIKKQQVENSVPWTNYAGLPVTPEQIPAWAIGYIYRIARLDQWGNVIKIYIGKKVLTSKRRTRIGIRAKKATKTRKTFQTTVKDSGWKQYWGSCVELREDVKKYGEKMFRRTIIEWCWSKKQMSYREMYYQVVGEVLTRDTYNGNVLNRWFKKDLIKPTVDDRTAEIK